MALRMLVFGVTGQVGRALNRLGGAGLEIVVPPRTQADLTDPELCARAIERADVDIVVNAAGFNSIDQAELIPGLAMRINADAPATMADAAAKRGLPFLHVSTHQVFDGGGTQPWLETDLAKPMNTFARSKRAGELAIQRAGGMAVILRTSWIFDDRGQNFVTSVLRAAQNKQPMRVVNDQWAGPTPASALARTIVILSRAISSGRGQPGIYHFAGAPDVTRYGLAKAIVARANLRIQPELTPIQTTELSSPAYRPLNGRLDCSRIARIYGIRQPDWRSELAEMLMTNCEAAV